MAHAAFNWQDPFLLESQLSDDERMVRDAAQAYCQDKLLPRVVEAFRSGTTDVKIFREMGELGLLGPTIPEEFGGPGLNYVAYGLIAREDALDRYELSDEEFESWVRAVAYHGIDALKVTTLQKYRQL